MATLTDPGSGPFSLGPVLKEELCEITKIRNKRNPDKSDLQKLDVNNPPYGIARPAATSPVEPIAGTASPSVPEWQTDDQMNWLPTIANAHKNNLTGLALSGGGIRSAAFNLGVLQALAELKLLFRFDYLSTVSGGGYIGAWLAAWIKREGSFAEVQKRLAPNRVHQEDNNEPYQIRSLRVFSNYLTPKLGLSGDSFAAGAIIATNILLNQIVLFAALTTLLLIPRVVVRGMEALARYQHRSFLPVFMGLLAVAFFTIMYNMLYLDVDAKKKVPCLTEQKAVLLLVALPLFLNAILAFKWKPIPLHFLPVSIFCGASYTLVWCFAILIASLVSWRLQKTDPRRILFEYSTDASYMLVGAIPAGALAGCLFVFLWRLRSLPYWNGTQADITFGVPLVVGIFLLAGTVHIGIMGISFRDRRREWWGRLGGWLIFWAAAWCALFAVALYFRYSISHLPPWAVKLLQQYVTPAWVVTTLAGLIVAKRGDTSGQGKLTWKDVLAKAAPYIFVVGLFCLLSLGLDQLIAATGWLYRLLGISLAVTLFMAWRVDVNQFSMHQMYRNRLVRCFLGASNKNRSPNRFTGIDATDDEPLKTFVADEGYDGPYPVMNAALNLAKGKDLAWQERKAASFVMTPRYCGYDVWLEEQDSPITHQSRNRADELLRTEKRGQDVSAMKQSTPVYTSSRRFERFGYRPTEEYAFPPPRGTGLNMGTAMGISGAAATPNMGFYTSAPVAFLMTVFNVRLGQWLGNPRHKRTWRRATPGLGLTYLLKELLAGSTDESSYVYLSDGGHFENMGLYELVKRRCGLIVVCDAEADGSYGYAGLANAIRKCGIDMGIPIDLDVSAITPAKEGEPGKKHFAIGTIHYERADVNAPTGVIVYFKASLTGDEPTDVQNYKKTHCSFPHDSTADQWFSESQFECYRKLGYHEVTTAFQGAFAPQQQPAQGVLASAAAALSKAITALEPPYDAPPAEPETAEHKLKDTLEDFGFDISGLKQMSKAASTHR